MSAGRSVSREGIRQRRRPVQPFDVCRIVWSVGMLRHVRTHLVQGGAHHAADYVARALKSAEGALRHAERMARP